MTKIVYQGQTLLEALPNTFGLAGRHGTSNRPGPLAPLGGYGSPKGKIICPEHSGGLADLREMAGNNP